MTPAIDALDRAGIQYRLHEYDHDPSADSYSLEAASKLGVSEARLFKTLVVRIGGSKDLAVAVLPASKRLDFKAFAKAVGVKNAAMADRNVVEKTTGYVLGGVSPLGQRKKLRTLIDESATACETIYVSAGRRGLQIELAPDDLRALTDAQLGSIGV